MDYFSQFIATWRINFFADHPHKKIIWTSSDQSLDYDLKWREQIKLYCGYQIKMRPPIEYNCLH
jgi:hypothetical protein